MPRISFCFSGHMNEAEIESVVDAQSGEKVDVRALDADYVVGKLRSGDWALSLADALAADSASAGIEVFDFEVEGE